MDEKEPSQDEFSSTRWDFLAPAAAGAIAIAVIIRRSPR